MAILESGEMYLETIYILSQKSSAVRGIDVGEYMGFSKPSVSRAIGLLKHDGLVYTDSLDGKEYTVPAESRYRDVAAEAAAQDPD